jgi:hypothetical protein
MTFSPQALNSKRPELQVGKWVAKYTLVPVVSLAEVIPCLLAGPIREIDFLMCDAQGSDLAIMKGAGSALQSVNKVVSLHPSCPAVPREAGGPSSRSRSRSRRLCTACGPAVYMEQPGHSARLFHVHCVHVCLACALAIHTNGVHCAPFASLSSTRDRSAPG